MELSAAKGIYTSFSSDDFRLVGDIAAGGLAAFAIIPEPAAFPVPGLLLLGPAVCGQRRKR